MSDRHITYTDSSSTSRLPPELERWIFEEAVISDASCFAQIILVSRRAHQWIAPLVLRDLRFPQDAQSLPKFLEFFDSKSPTYFSPHVKSLLTQSPELCRKLIPAAHGLQHLAVWIYMFEFVGTGEDLDLIVESILGLKELRRLSLSYTDWVDRVLNDACKSTGEGHENFAKLTHLDIGSLTVPEPQTLASFPSLTHFAITFIDGRDMLSDENLKRAKSVLEQMERLRAFVVICNDKDVLLVEENADKLPKDRRVYVTQVKDWEEDWDAWLKGRPDFWDEADAAVAERLKLEAE